MKQALTAAGLPSVWYDSACAALRKIGVGDIQADGTGEQLQGNHPEFGPIHIDFLVPQTGKTRMEISVNDAKFMQAFKKAVAFEFKHRPLEEIPNSEDSVNSEEKQTEKTVESVEPEMPVEVPESTTPEYQLDSSDTENTEVIKDDVSGELVDPSEYDQESDDDEPIKYGTSYDELENDTHSLLDELHSEDEQSFSNDEESKLTESVRYCKKCGATIEAEDKICPECGKKQGVSGVVIAVIVGAVIIVGAIGFIVFNMLGNRNENNSNIDSLEISDDVNAPDGTGSPTVATGNPVTAAQFEQVQNGMTYADVVGVFGREGTLLSESTYQDESGNDVQLKIYYWEGQGETGANASISFQGDLVVTKSSYGLQ